MEYLQKSLQNALDLANIDFNKIFNIINNDGSIAPYIEHVKELGRDFERAFSLLILNSSPAQITTYTMLNLKKINLAIDQIKIFENLCLKYQNEVNLNFINKEILDDEMRPIQQAHLSELNYIKDLLNTTLENINGVSIHINEESPINKTDEIGLKKSQISIDDSLSNYGDYITVKDMENIFHVKRNTIYRWEKEGYFNRCSPSNKSVRYEKKAIQRYLLSRE
ncbi:MAG: helix-turn-helix domain-containing protein [Bacteroidales bacterium]|nr:helix-turn-helix domain-containing protein [Bacteroidales bacterium]